MKLNTIILTPILLLSQSAISVSYSDIAKITSVDKIYRTHTIREPYQDCYIEEFYQNEGDGSGKDAKTIAGPLLGASFAYDDELAKSKMDAWLVKKFAKLDIVQSWLSI
ncbi:hypothetical protein BHECKSOX_673 [Bathymodiolus heckerae thiotrophic gill symbiont]|uniref:hypothetical protein n=1 Tax=Bathymodiolus heckerae thiotrophic gill symbiont TaxID=1052212 RepID=UPI0010B643DC|nr:hypothetical protein [Bathymodiolus heckerae thiotrophic gill symbiont]CAC9588433.1 hypothetical protein [uncultured Gammaproteobacteria bacterium]SHN90492.1 hypothetical protein BHECKSOX_673 [Bathymodiolus heckerae thiotrophic gill symbiont]